MPITIFFCYAREDEQLLNKLKAHLRPLQRQGLIDVWHDRDISAGTEWEKEISEHLNTAQIILLLVSPDFMDSDYCYGIEMKRALERNEKGEAKVIPIILRSVYWHGEPLGKLQALPTDGKPVTNPDWHNLDRAFYDVTRGIHTVVEPLIVQAKRASFIERLRVLRTLTGHTDSVNSVAISPDGLTLVSGSVDHTIKLWELPSGKVIQTLIGHTKAVNSVTISPNGLTLVSASSDCTIKVWDLPTGTLVRTFSHIGPANSVTISPDGLSLVSGGWDGSIMVWDLPSGRLVRTLTGHTGSVRSVAISPDGLSLVSGSYDGTIKVWDLPIGKELRTLTGHTRPVLSVAIRTNGQTIVIVSASIDGTIIVWGV